MLLWKLQTAVRQPSLRQGMPARPGQQNNEVRHETSIWAEKSICLFIAPAAVTFTRPVPVTRHSLTHSRRSLVREPANPVSQHVMRFDCLSLSLVPEMGLNSDIKYARTSVFYANPSRQL